MRIAILGIRGVPANSGGFETFAEQLGTRLTARGHEVTVYGRDRYIAGGLRAYRGMHIVRLLGRWVVLNVDGLEWQLGRAAVAAGRAWDVGFGLANLKSTGIEGRPN